MYIFIVLVVVIFLIVKFLRSPKKQNKNLSKLPTVISHSETLNSFNDIQFDTLAHAAELGHRAEKAVKNKDYNEAWKLLHEQKSLYLKHCHTMKYNARQTFSLDSNIHESLANILRLENKHFDAFFHIMYWVIASYDRPIKKHGQKLVAYFNRCKFKKITIEDVQAYVNQHGPSLVNTLEIKDQVRQWKDNE